MTTTEELAASLDSLCGLLLGLEKTVEELRAQQIADTRDRQALELRVEAMERELASLRRSRLDRLRLWGGQAR